jgi:D-arabinose 1-dehydrogenase-like Zn-dependent alcohol dehydrogenase
LFFKQQSLLGSTMGTRAGMRHLWDAFCEGTYKATVGATLPMSRLAEAHKLLEERTVLGKSRTYTLCSADSIAPICARTERARLN